MSGVSLEWTIKIGDLLTLAGGVAVAFGLFYKRGGADSDFKNAIVVLTKDLGEMKEQMKSFSTAIRDLAVQRTEINLLMKWYDELRRGVGLVRDKE